MNGSLPTQELLASAAQAREHAYCPYSHYAVGAAVRLSDGAVFTGCNVENASYGLTICAERSAIFAAVAASAEPPHLVAVAVVGGPRARSAINPHDVTPCGACLQVIAEFAGPDCAIVCANADTLDAPRTYTLRDLLPHAFGSR